ncbi:hypothetical protein ACS0PU_012470 [Formica fusca]
MSDKENEENQVDEAFGELLANFAQRNPCLYDKKCKEYKDKNFVADTWSSIASACNMSVDMVQKQWKILRGQFTREHRLEKMYEPSGTGNDTSKSPRKTWYLYHSLLFLAPHVAHRSTSSNFVRGSTIITQSSPSTPQSALQLASQSASGSSFSNVWTPNLFSDGSTPPPERSTSSESLATSVSSISQSKSLAIARRDLLSPPPDQSATRRLKESHKEQEQLSKMIGNTTETINMLMHNLTEKRSQPVSDDNGEEAAMAKALIYALRRVSSKYKIQCYIKCLSVLDKYQNLTTVETVQNL